jgi:translation initiation factor IF-2
MRVHELAKELGIASKDLILQLKGLGYDVKNHMSVVEEEVVLLVREKIKRKIPLQPSGIPPVSDVKSKTKEARKKKEVQKKQPEAKETPLAVKTPPSEEILAEKISETATVLTEAPPAASMSPAPAVVAVSIPVRFPITVGQFAAQLNLRVSDLIKALMGIGIFANVNQLLNEEIGFKAAEKLGVVIEKEVDEAEKLVKEKKEWEDPKQLKPRPPVVTLMGHVDHGKTSLLDAIRKTNVAAKEKGFITQHIGAYGVDIPDKGHVTFLDTPGHEAFTAMRARGAIVTDVVVLVVAADDGVMPQTIEAVDHAREAGCPIVVAINKSDLPTANPQKVMLGLQKIELVPEEWGGKSICVKVSAKTGKGLDELLEMLLLEAEILELKANPDRLASGTVIEGHLSKGSGPVVTVIVQKGTLRVGDIVLCGPYTGRVRSLKNDRGKIVKEAGPSYAVELSGLSGLPEAGETFTVVEDEKTARKIAEQRILEQRQREMQGVPKHLSLEDLYHRITEGNFKELKLVIKADVQGSIEALTQALEKLSTDKCQLRVIHGGVGGVNESDIMLAAASDAIVLGFHVKEDPSAQALIEKEGVDVRFYNIIYDAVEDIRKAMEGLLEPSYKEVIEGRVEIRRIFKSSRAGTIGGAMVLKGKITRQHRIRVLRNHIVVFEGKLASLRRFKDDVRDVSEGYECGIAVEGFDDLRERDIIESYRLEKVAAKL